MIQSKVIIVGGGPAGSSCAWKLRQHQIDCLILDKQGFPRPKVCAGWITPDVFRDLKIKAANYPHALMRFNQFRIHLRDHAFKLRVHQYAIRRIEFDDWLLQRSGAAFFRHEVKNIIKDGKYYVIDDQFAGQYLVGAGGTHCPVFRTFFKSVHPRSNECRIIALEEEFNYAYSDSDCHLWFRQNQLPGYAWYVPKPGGYLNIGIGGFAEKLKVNPDTIKNHWSRFIYELDRLSLVKNHHFNPKGAVYYIWNQGNTVQSDHTFLIGDAAGIATRDMGEGIGPAVKSGMLAANAIASGKKLSFNSIKKQSFGSGTRVKMLFSYFVNHYTRPG